MLEKIITWDQNLFLFLNGLHHPSVDPFMIFVSDSLIPSIFIFLLFLIYGFEKYKKLIFIALIFVLTGLGISDSVSTRVFKPTVKRLRPYKEPAIKAKAYIPKGRCCPGKYGFFSSHASNTFTLAMFVWLLFGRFSKHFAWLFAYASLVSYSRIYLSKHYPLDLIAGALFGILVGHLMYKLMNKLLNLEASYPNQL